WQGHPDHLDRVANLRIRHVRAHHLPESPALAARELLHRHDRLRLLHTATRWHSGLGQRSPEEVAQPADNPSSVPICVICGFVFSASSASPAVILLLTPAGTNTRTPPACSP